MKFDFSKITQEQSQKFLNAIIGIDKEFGFGLFTPAPPVTPAPEAKKFGEGTLSDGTVIKWDGDQPPVVGTALMVVDPQNPNGFIPIPDSPPEGFTDNQGNVFMTKDGKITEIKPAAPAAPGMAEQVAQMSAQIKELTEKFEAVNKEKETLKSDFDKIKTEAEGVKTAHEETKTKLKETLEMFAKVMDHPAAKPEEAPVYKKPTSGVGSKVGK